MASRIQGITVEIGGDTTKLTNALKGVNGEIRNTQSQLKDVEKLLKLDPSNTELLSQKQRLLTQEVQATKEKFYKGSGKERGSGIGLAVCEEIVMRHGGKLLIENAKDGGVLATVMLPLKNEDFLESDASHGRKKERM